MDPPSDGLWMITWMCHVLDHGSGDVIHGDGMTDTPWTSVWGPGVHIRRTLVLPLPVV